MSDLNIVAATPPIIIGAAATVSLSLGLLPWRRVRLYGPGLIAGGAIVAAMIMSALLWGDRQVAFDGNLYADRFSLLLNFIFLTAGLAAVSMSWREPSAVDRRGEYSGLLLMSIAGMMLVAGAGDLIVLFLGIELLSIGLYVLCALEVWRERSLESGLKYLIVGSVGSAFFLYGLALLFGSTGSVKLQEIGEAVADTSLLGEPMLLAAMAFIVVGLGFKASAAPFHMWTPDVYEGAPTTITAFMATATKAAAIAAFLRIFQGVLPDIEGDWQAALASIAVASVVVGTLAALVQRNMKRLLAYSSVAQAGYLLIGITAGTIEGAQATLYYLIAYLAMTLAAFAVVIAREREVADGDEISSLAGYWRRRPMLSVVMTVAMLSLAGFPPLSGFIGKFLIFGSAVEADIAWLAVVGALGSVVSVVYYLRVVAVIWFSEPADDPAEPRIALSGGVAMTTVLSAAAVIALSLMASQVLEVCQGAAQSLLAP